MENATRDGDETTLRNLLAELVDTIARTTHRTDNGQVAIPGNIADLTTTVLSRLGWRTRK
jgi:hypothetical protein